MEVKLKKEFVSFLIESNVLKFGEFTTKSNRKTPYFINTGNFKYGKQLNVLSKFYADFIVNSKVEYDCLFGPAYKGISLVVACCNALYEHHKINKPFFFNRKEIKDHGEGGSFIGHKPKEGEKIIIIEDVLTAGTAVKEILPTLKKQYNVECFNMFVLVNRCEFGNHKNIKASDELKEKFGLTVNSLISIKDIIEFLENNSKYEELKKSMQNYINSYCIL